MELTPSWATEMSRRLKASHAIILYGNTADYVQNRTRLIQFLLTWFGENKTIVVSRTETTWPKGIEPPPQSPFGRDINSELSAARSLLKSPHHKGLTLIIKDSQTIAPDAEWATMSPSDRDAVQLLSELGTDLTIANASHTVILIAPQLHDVHRHVRNSGFSPIPIPLPDDQRRAEFVNFFATKEGLTISAELKGDIVRASGGMTLFALDDAMWAAMANSADLLASVRHAKRAHFEREYANLLTPVEPVAGGLDAMGGYHWLKTVVKERIIGPMRSGTNPPMGVLLMGPAGTGKSFFVRCVAAELGFPVVELEIGGKIASKWQGEGERNLMHALDAIRAMSPVAVLIDEVDQAIHTADSGADNMQESRIAQMLLKFMADTRHRGKVIFFAATNRPDMIDARLKRPGRFDLKIVFTLPNPQERCEILSLYAKRFGIAPPTEKVVHATDGWTPAELEFLSIKASSTSWERAIETVRATTQAIPEMLRSALAEVNDSDLLPPHMRSAPEQIETNIRRARGM